MNLGPALINHQIQRKADKNMIEIAAKIIAQQEGDFDPTGFKDHYEDALRALIKEKEKSSGRAVTAKEPEQEEIGDLMEALRNSLKGSASGRKPAAKKAPAKKPAAKNKAA